MSAVLLLDSNIWSHLVLSNVAKRTAVQQALAALHAQYPGAAVATSALCVAECLVAARRLPDAAERAAAEAAFQRFFDDPSVIVVDVSQPLLDRAATLRAQALRQTALAQGQPAGPDGGKLRLPDAVVAATCLEFVPPAVLVTENIRDFTLLDAQGQPQAVAGLVVERVG
jgi:predicted nucleic acid-binding protein